jgi:uncharacterized protein YjbJ (UPF0337 family)
MAHPGAEIAFWPMHISPRHKTASGGSRQSGPKSRGIQTVVNVPLQSCPGRPAEQEKNMNWDQIEGKWKQLTGSAQERWGKLTNDDIQTLTGQMDHLVGKIQERYGIAKAEAEKQADAWSHALKETRPESPATRL